MTPTEHKAKAEELLGLLEDRNYTRGMEPASIAVVLQEAQVHATLAAAANPTAAECDLVEKAVAWYLAELRSGPAGVPHGTPYGDMYLAAVKVARERGLS
ncbi:hypothetical protein [Paractinoplanes atraurantiacus]|uniref:Uncharacterized protein n=1 Tax=Paractinoplanes atraurantiacus TaxID=1036182 RepID=A0A285KFU1_9ACTN|nr:hypothetical protein [Actinoplanes atraurantiacus]SNY70161.1 hypothetical protein SAMN05421748_13729 [Actinoplanes atraurantiacus]